MLRICLQLFVQDCVTHALHLIWQSFQQVFEASIFQSTYRRLSVLQRYIGNTVKHLWWSFCDGVFGIFLFSSVNFSQEAPSQMFDWVLNTPLQQLLIICDKYGNLDITVTITLRLVLKKLMFSCFHDFMKPCQFSWVQKHRNSI